MSEFELVERTDSVEEAEYQARQIQEMAHVCDDSCDLHLSYPYRSCRRCWRSTPPLPRC